MKNTLKGAFALALLVMLMVGAVAPSEYSANIGIARISEQSLVVDTSAEMHIGFNNYHVGEFGNGQWLYLPVEIAGMNTGTEQEFPGEVSMLPITTLAHSATDHRGAGQNLPPRKPPIDYQGRFSSKNHV